MTAKYRTLSPKEAAAALLKLNNPTVIIHARPDADAVGTGAALTLALNMLGIGAALLSPDDIPSRLSFLTDETPTVREPKLGDAVTVDVASRAQLGRLSDANVTISIDHHAFGTPFADNLTDGNASSAAEVLFEVLCELEKISSFKTNKKIAALLYAAMSSDTGGFIYSNAGAKAHVTAARLIEYGIDFADINHRLFNSKSESLIRAEGYIASNIKKELDGKIAYATVSKAQRDSLGLKSADFDTAVDVLRSLEGVEIALYVRENDDGTLRASMRSTGFNVARVAEKFFGGGHTRAAGCSPVASTAEDGANQILTEIKKTITGKGE